MVLSSMEWVRDSSVVRLVDLAEQHRRIQAEVEEAVVRVLRSGVYVLGPEVAALEAELAASCGVRHAVACASGTVALVLALLALGLRPGDEVIVPAFTIYVDAEGSLPPRGRAAASRRDRSAHLHASTPPASPSRSRRALAR